MKECDLYPIVKKMFKERGYSVFAEVAHFMRGIDLVAIKEEEHIAVELKLSFNWDVVRQAHTNKISFDKSYVAYPVKKPVLFHSEDVYWKLRDSTKQRYDRCVKEGIGIFQILPSGVIFEALEGQQLDPVRRMDFTHHKESEHDLGGLPSQKGVSAGYYELECIKDYVREHPDAKWKEIYDNVHNHYSNEKSLAGCMASWRGFSLSDFKKSLRKNEQEDKVEMTPLFT